MDIIRGLMMAAGCSAPDARTFWLCPALGVQQKLIATLNRVYRTGRETVEFLDPESFKNSTSSVAFNFMI